MIDLTVQISRKQERHEKEAFSGVSSARIYSCYIQSDTIEELEYTHMRQSSIYVLERDGTKSSSCKGIESIDLKDFFTIVFSLLNALFLLP